MINIMSKNHPQYTTVMVDYVVKRDGTVLNVRELTEEEILELISLDLKDYCSTEGSSYAYSENDLRETTDLDGNKTFVRREPEEKNRALDSVSLVRALNSANHPYRRSKYFLFRLGQIRKQYPELGKILCDNMLVEDYYNKAAAIARFQKDCAEDFSTVSWEDLLGVLEQLVINEKNRKNAKAKS